MAQDNETDEISYPESEILDSIEMDGPQTTQEAAGSIFTIDQAFDALESLESDRHIKSERGNYERFGTTERVWYVPEQPDESE